MSGGQAEIRNALIAQLEFNNVLITSRPEDAPATLTITEFDTERRTLSVNSLGQVAEYEFNTRLAVLISRDQELIPLETQARRTLSNDVNNVVATQQEEAELRNTLRTEVITRLMRRLQRLESSQAAGNQ
ncbi:MAG: LPS assembly lipoprotein LptE [Thalassolituus sp.]